MLARAIPAAVLLFACSGQDKPTAPDPCNTPAVTVAQGAYGVVYQECGDLGGPCPGKPAEGQPVAAYSPAASGSASMGNMLAMSATDADGFYQLDVSGTIALCVGVNPACTNSVSISGITRWDYIDLDGTGSKWRQLGCP